jgi:hypothetical protein
MTPLAPNALKFVLYRPPHLFGIVRPLCHHSFVRSPIVCAIFAAVQTNKRHSYLLSVHWAKGRGGGGMGAKVMNRSLGGPNSEHSSRLTRQTTACGNSRRRAANPSASFTLVLERCEEIRHSNPSFVRHFAPPNMSRHRRRWSDSEPDRYRVDCASRSFVRCYRHTRTCHGMTTNDAAVVERINKNLCVQTTRSLARRQVARRRLQQDLNCQVFDISRRRVEYRQKVFARHCTDSRSRPTTSQ